MPTDDQIMEGRRRFDTVNYERLTSLEHNVAEMRADLRDIRDKDIESIRATIRTEYVHNLRFWPVAVIVYGFVAAVLGGFVTALVSLIIAGEITL